MSMVLQSLHDLEICLCIMVTILLECIDVQGYTYTTRRVLYLQPSKIKEAKIVTESLNSTFNERVFKVMLIFLLYLTF